MDITRSLSGQSGSMSFSPSSSGPNTWHMEKPATLPPSSATTQNCPGSDIASSKSPSSR